MNISAKIVADSISQAGDRITTFELEYPRFIHGELMTHRMFSRNAASSRAIPIDKVITLVETNLAKPIHWGVNQSGMQANNSHEDIELCASVWKQAAQSAVVSAKQLQELGLHKQIVNRVLEPFQIMKTVVTATSFDNFFYLRCHKDAQPEIKVLAEVMYTEYEKSSPEALRDGEWHTPYVGHFRASDGDAKVEYIADRVGISVEDALKISASCCAQVSYRKTDQSLDKALKIYDMLVSMKPVHASPLEHQATPFEYTQHRRFPEMAMEYGAIEDGLTHVDVEGYSYSGNFKGWVQHRQLIDNNVCDTYEEK